MTQDVHGTCATCGAYVQVVLDEEEEEFVAIDHDGSGPDGLCLGSGDPVQESDSLHLVVDEDFRKDEFSPEDFIGHPSTVLAEELDDTFGDDPRRFL